MDTLISVICILCFQQSEIEQIEKTERVGGEQQHKRVKAALIKQIEQNKTKLDQVL